MEIVSTSPSISRNQNNWEIPYKELVFGKLVGTGAYGEVYQGTWRNVSSSWTYYFEVTTIKGNGRYQKIEG